MPLPEHCPDCGGRIGPHPDEPGAGKCRGCQREVFANPKPAAGVFVERDGKLLLVRRGAEPAKGRWDIPGGYMKEGETAEQAARREAREETGLDLGELRLALTDINPGDDG